VIVDLDLLEKAPSRMNRAGAAEILCSHTALFDWRVGFEAGVDNQWDAEVERFTRAELDVMRSFASEIGADRTEAFVRILEIGGKFADKFINYPRARFNGGSEHIFAWAFEEVTRKRLIHGEAVSLGILLMAHIEENDPDEAAKIIQTAKISFKPEHIGLTWDEVNTTATQVLGYAARVPWYTCLNEFAKRGEEGSREFMRRYIAARAFVERLS
jgi:glycerol-1-phosphate dehydrogenase [NAD(P)+]